MCFSLYLWFRHLSKKGIKQKSFPITKITLITGLLSGCCAIWGSPLATYLHNQINPILSIGFIVFIASIFFCLFHYFPLSEVVPEETSSGRS
jgi:fructose-specific phosphotransferase system IIC component